MKSSVQGQATEYVCTILPKTSPGHLMMQWDEGQTIPMIQLVCKSVKKGVCDVRRKEEAEGGGGRTENEETKPFRRLGPRGQ